MLFFYAYNLIKNNVKFMGLYNLVEQLLPENFSIYQFMAILDMDREDAREARNILKQFSNRGYIFRTSKNMYKKEVSPVK